MYGKPLLREEKETTHKHNLSRGAKERMEEDLCQAHSRVKPAAPCCFLFRFILTTTMISRGARENGCTANLSCAKGRIRSPLRIPCSLVKTRRHVSKLCKCWQYQDLLCLFLLFLFCCTGRSCLRHSRVLVNCMCVGNLGIFSCLRCHPVTFMLVVQIFQKSCSVC